MRVLTLRELTVQRGSQTHEQVVGTSEATILLSISYTLVSKPGSLTTSPCLIATQPHKELLFPHFTEEATEAQRGR